MEKRGAEAKVPDPNGLSAPLSLSHVFCSGPQWRLFSALLAEDSPQIRGPFPRASICEAVIGLFPSHLAFLPSFHAASIDSPPPPPPLVTGESHKKRPSRIAFLPSACALALAARLR